MKPDDCAWRLLPAPIMLHDDARRRRLIYGRIAHGHLSRWSPELEPWATHWLLLPADAVERITDGE